MIVRIHGHTLPGLVFDDASGRRYESVHVGLQSGKDPVQLAPADAASVDFETEVELRTVAGEADFRGACVHGRRGDRFIYLTWGEPAADGGFAMFRRIKLLLRDVDAELFARAAEPGMVLTATLGLTDRRCGPACGSVRPPAVLWQVAPA